MIRRHFFEAMIIILGLFAAMSAGPFHSLTAGQELARAQLQTPIRPATDIQTNLSSSFTYQGFVRDSGSPVDDVCDFTFALYDAALGGTQLGTTETQINVTVSEGRFTVQLNDAGQFGANAFQGEARWLEVSLRCPAGSGSYTVLSPRQSLTASPYALSLRPGATISGSLSLGILNVTNSWGNGFFVSSAGYNGLDVLSTGQHGVLLRSVADDGVYVIAAGDDGMEMESVGDDGVRILSAGGTGVSVGSAGDDGYYVAVAGNPDSSSVSGLSNGYEVAGAAGNGLYVGRSDQSGVHVQSAGWDGLAVNAAGGNGVRVVSAGNNGLRVDAAISDAVRVESAGGSGVHVLDSTNDGVHINTAGNVGFRVDAASSDGVYVGSAGNPSSTVPSPLNHGLEVAGAEAIGLWIGHGEFGGVWIDSNGGDGVVVNAAGNSGLRVQSAGLDGVRVNSAGNLAGYFNGDVTITGACTGCALAAFGINVSEVVLEPGHLVALRPAPASYATGAAPTLLALGPAETGEAVIGVVANRAERYEEEGQEPYLVPREGVVQPGEYVTIITHGLAQVWASADPGAIDAGEQLTVKDSGTARQLQTREWDGMIITEGTPTVGIALEGLAAGEEGLIWVLVGT